MVSRLKAYNGLIPFNVPVALFYYSENCVPEKFADSKFTQLGRRRSRLKIGFFLKSYSNPVPCCILLYPEVRMN